MHDFVVKFTKIGAKGCKKNCLDLDDFEVICSFFACVENKTQK
jgi:hypothetical protein